MEINIIDHRRILIYMKQLKPTTIVLPCVFSIVKTYALDIIA